MCASLTRLFDGRAMGRALAVSLPLFVLYSASGDANWLLANRSSLPRRHSALSTSAGAVAHFILT